MIDLLLLALALAAASAIGRQCLRLLRYEAPTRLERLTIGATLGLGVIGYAVLAIGLAGFLRPLPVLVALVVLVAASWRGARDAVRDLRGLPPWRWSPGGIAAAVLLVLLAGVAALSCFSPPGAHEWDALSYHLAVPQIYLQHERILFLPTQHHSNFPFLWQMLFTVGLMARGPELAALFHWAAAALATAGVAMLARRHGGPGAGNWAAVAFATTPIVLWQAGTAYIDVAQALCTTLAVHCLLEWRRTREAPALLAAGALLGMALGVKTLSLLPLGLLTGYLLIARAPVRQLAAYLAVAVAIGCPFYVKTFIYTGNPVYPFAYRLFGGRYWSVELSKPYEAEQRSFGMSRNLIGPRDDARTASFPYEAPSAADRVRNALLTPFMLVSVPRIYYNLADPGVFNHAGYLFLALPMLLLVAPQRSSGAVWLAALAAVWLAASTLNMQYVRYLVPVLALAAAAGGEGASQVRRMGRLPSALLIAAVSGQAAVALWTFGADTPARWAVATNAEARQEYLRRSLNHYRAIEWLNGSTGPRDGVVLFEETRGFHLDRPYLWGNANHSLYIPYRHFASGEEMIDWFLARGYRHALLNLRFAPMAATVEGQMEIRRASVEGTLPALTVRWYRPGMDDRERWRELLGQALHGARAVVVPEATGRGAVVLEFRAAVSSGGGH